MNALRAALSLGLLAAALAASAQNLVTNGSFETRDFTGYTTTGTVALSTGLGTVNGGTLASDGTVFTVFGFNSAPGSLQQTVPTVAGRSYTVSFDLKPVSSLANNATPTSTFLVMFANAPLLSLVNPAPTAGYTPYSFTTSSLLGNDTLSFSATNGSGGLYALDNIRVTAVQATPEPSALAALGLGAVAFAKRRKRA